MERISFLGWDNCCRLSSGRIDVVVTADVGPRVIRFGFSGGENVFKIVEAEQGLTGGADWRLYGGHRLWHAPEMTPRTYYPDNDPVMLSEENGVLVATQPVEPTTGIQKQLALRVWPDRDRVTVTHRLANQGLWPVELAPWALSVMAPGGVGILPLPPRGSHAENLLPTASVVLWAYTDMADPRWMWGRECILLRQDPAAQIEQKVGVSGGPGWAAYARDSLLFVKTFLPQPDAPYPDRGCSAELYTDANLLEVETLGPLARLEPGESVEHVEDWHLFRDVPTPRDEADVNEWIIPRVAAIREES